MLNSLGERIKSLRENKDLSQTQLSKIIGIQNATLCQYEKNLRVPSDEIKIKIAKYFNVTIDYLLGLSENKNYKIIFSEDETKLIKVYRTLNKEAKDKLKGYVDALNDNPYITKENIKISK